MKAILKVLDIKKTYPGVEALKGVSVEFYPGEIHAIVGENGAGKSTLVEIISGSLKPTSGQVIFDGKELKSGVARALDSGIAIVHQERNLVPSFNATENIFLGQEKLSKRKKGRVQEVEDLMKRSGIYVDTKTPIKYLGEGEKQLIEILKIIHLKPKVMILDEPTSSIDKKDIERLFDILRKLRKEKVAIIIITHHLEEVFQIADRVTVLRNGRKIATKAIHDVTEQELISMMIEKNIQNRYPKTNVPSEKELLRVENIVAPGVKVDNLVLHKGEIVGLAGLVGSGRTEFLEALYGYRKIVSGQIFLNNERIKISSPHDSIKRGIYLIPEDRNNNALFLRSSLRYNVTIPFLRKFARFLGIVNSKNETTKTIDLLKHVNCDFRRINEDVKNLSGGNKQKVLLARWMLQSPCIYLLDEPTQGIDVNAKTEFFKILCQTINTVGVGVILVSSDLPELLAMSDRIYVFRYGTVVDSLERNEFSNERVLNSMLLTKVDVR
ncbi:MAG TPA: sugar ABC transporter ATP-binding protein [Candidatus Marinimicrobia bacterium]|nr:sugar ABC transporter ATP-binding protein [Candidatus Neomarinimicrobiota bacterium]